MLSSLEMAEHSPRSRASGIARDLWMLGRVRSLEEITQKIEAVTPASVSEYYARNPAENFSVMTLGPRKLERPNSPMK